MTKVCICDIDKVFVSPLKRFEAAATEDGKIVWEKALSSELLHLDELMSNAVENLATIRSRYDLLILLTSRYDHMRNASLAWLKDHGITCYDRAIFKPWDERYTKTKRWKAEQVLKILQEVSQPDLWSRLPQLAITELLVIDDNNDNLQEISQEVGRWIMSNRQMRAYYFLSMQEAV